MQIKCIQNELFVLLAFSIVFNAILVLSSLALRSAFMLSCRLSILIPLFCEYSNEQIR